MHLTRVALDDLIYDKHNARHRTDQGRATIRHSLQKFGQVENLIVQHGTNMIVGGHGRVDELRALGETHAWVQYKDLTDAEALELNTVLNRSADLGTYDTEQQGLNLQELQRAGTDLAHIGFGEDDVLRLVGPELDLHENDDVPDAGGDAAPTSIRGSGDATPPAPTPGAAAPPSYVRMIQLFFNADTQQELLALLEDLTPEFDAENQSDLILEVVRAYHGRRMRPE